jgi:hypothetical protein
LWALAESCELLSLNVTLKPEPTVPLHSRRILLKKDMKIFAVEFPEVRKMDLHPFLALDLRRFFLDSWRS